MGIADSEIYVEPARCEFEWLVEAKRFNSKKPRLSKSEETRLGRFALFVTAIRTSDGPGGSSFRAAGGRGTVDVKSFTDVPCRLTKCTIGDHCVNVNHDFTRDGHLCHIPGVWDFMQLALQGEVNMIFQFQSTSSHKA